MIGINFSYPDIVDKLRHPPWLELRCARIEPGPPNLVWSKGESYDVCYYWRNWDIPLEERTRLMDAIVKQLVSSHKVDGFTLWWNWTKKIWQMNVRHEGEAWSITHITQAQAEAIFATLEASHPDGPWKVIDEYVQDDAAAAAEVHKANTSSTAYRREESMFGALPEGKPSLPLADALRRAEEAAIKLCGVLSKISGEVEQ